MLNLDVTAATSNEEVVPVRERKHFCSNINKTGYVIFSVSHFYRCYKQLAKFFAAKICAGTLLSIELYIYIYTDEEV